MVLPFVNTPADLAGSVVTYAAAMSNLSAIADQKVVSDAIEALSRARAWVAISDGKGGYIVGFAKHVGYVGNSLEHYAKYRKTRDSTRLDGTEAERRVRALGGTSYAVGAMVGINNKSKALKVPHPAVDAVRSFVDLFGKTPNTLAEVLVFDNITPDMAQGARKSAAPQAVLEVLVAAISTANLDEGALDDLFARVKAARA